MTTFILIFLIVYFVSIPTVKWILNWVFEEDFKNIPKTFVSFYTLTPVINTAIIIGFIAMCVVIIGFFNVMKLIHLFSFYNTKK